MCYIKYFCFEILHFKSEELWEAHRRWKGFTKHLLANLRLPCTASIPASDLPRECWRRNAHLPLQTSATDPKNQNILFCSHGKIIEIRKLKVYVPVSSNFSSCSHVLWREGSPGAWVTLVVVSFWIGTISLALIFRARTGQLFYRRSLSLDLFHSVDSGCTFSIAIPQTMVSCESRYTHPWDLGRACLHYDFHVTLHSGVSVLPEEGGQHLVAVTTAMSCLLPIYWWLSASWTRGVHSGS